MLYNTGTIAINGNTATGTGTNWTSPASQVRAGQTIIVMSNPVQLFQISSVNSATSMTVTPAASPALSGQKYGILISDNISVDGLAQAMSQLIKEYDENIGAWETFATTSANQSITVTINGTSVNIPAIGALARKGANSDITSLSGLTTALSISQGGTGSTTASGARTNLGLGDSSTRNVGTAAGTVASGDDARLGTVNGKTGGTISSSVNITGNCITSHGNGFGVGTSGNYKLEMNSSATEPTATDGPIAWSITRWYSDAVMLVSRRSGSTTIKSQGIQFANGNQFEFLSTGSATCPGTFQGGSDERHKFNIELVKDPLASVLSFRGVTYDKKDGLPEVGLIAQDVERACPVAVSSSDDRIFRDGTVIPNFKYLNTAGTAAAFHTEAIKELLMLIEISIDDPQTAKERIAALKTKANEIAQREIENAAPWMEGPPDFNPKANGEGNSVQE